MKFSGKARWFAASGLALALVGSAAAQSSNVSVFAGGLNSPRGLKFGPDGWLYVAEGGLGGSNSTVGQCTQVPGVGPYTGGMTARISKISPNGARATVADNLPSAKNSPQVGGSISGVADVEFVHGVLYALLTGAGCSHGNPGTSNSVVKVNQSTGGWSGVVNLSAFLKNHPAANPELDDFEPDGDWYSLLNVNGALYAVEANHGEVDTVTLEGKAARLLDVSKFQGHIVPTSLAYHNGAFYIGNLDTFPIKDSAKVMKYIPGGELTVEYIGFQTILGLDFDAKGRLYVLEMTTDNLGPTPSTGKILRVDGKNKYTEIAKGLTFPTGMTFGPDGNIYVSNNGFGFPPGAGQVVKVVVP